MDIPPSVGAQQSQHSRSPSCTKLAHAVHGMQPMHSADIPRSVGRSQLLSELLAHRAWNPPPSSSLAEETTPPLAPPPCDGARSRRSQLLAEANWTT